MRSASRGCSPTASRLGQRSRFAQIRTNTCRLCDTPSSRCSPRRRCALRAVKGARRAMVQQRRVRRVERVPPGRRSNARWRWCRDLRAWSTSFKHARNRRRHSRSSIHAGCGDNVAPYGCLAGLQQTAYRGYAARPAGHILQRGAQGSRVAASRGCVRRNHLAARRFGRGRLLGDGDTSSRRRNHEDQLEASLNVAEHSAGEGLRASAAGVLLAGAGDRG